MKYRVLTNNSKYRIQYRSFGLWRTLKTNSTKPQPIELESIADAVNYVDRLETAYHIIKPHKWYPCARGAYPKGSWELL